MTSTSADNTSGSTPSVLRRRTFLAGAAAVGGAAGALALPQLAQASPRSFDADVYVLVVDGMRPDELRSDLTPTLTALADAGTRYSRAQAIDVAETLPNHAAMMTGVYPDRSGVPVNKIYDRELGTTRDLDRADDLWASTLLDRVRDECGLTTASVLSKHYLHGLFGDRASVVWDPAPLIPGTEHAPDQFTMDALIRIVDEHRPRLTFVNLGDVDRVGHLDFSGPSARIARTAAVRGADAQVQRFVTHLRSRGLWERSILVVLADHSMDWSVPTEMVNLSRVLNVDPLLAGNLAVAQNGGAETIYYTGDPAGRSAAIDRIIEIALATVGVQSAVPVST
ncbi:MAG: alkaline phosphatase family protein, partial [Rhodococcus sp.]|nr:alkaline phosphatase family protein [Rhodococcus sp. (in: high G+C Gram-positive bacteria)]